MTKGRLEAFSDGVLAIIITIMVLELKVPHGQTIDDLKPLAPIVLSYVLSFWYIGIYWNNHHHMLQLTERISGAVLWANLHLLFWLSLVPFSTAWVGETNFSAIPVAVYGFVLLMAGTAYFILQRTIIHVQGSHTTLAQAVGHDWKGKASVVLYLIGTLLAFQLPLVALTIYVLIAVIWVVPDRRLERHLHGPDHTHLPD